MNVECDFIWPETENFNQYKVIMVPVLYAAPDALLERLNQYVKDGGNLVAAFKTAFANENIKVSHGVQPHILNHCLGVKYHQFAFPKKVGLSGEIIGGLKEKERMTLESKCIFTSIILRQSRQSDMDFLMVRSC